MQEECWQLQVLPEYSGSGAENKKKRAGLNRYALFLEEFGTLL